jgi:hypothetical protein
MLGTLRESSGPFLFLFLFPEAFFPLPVRHTIASEMNVDIKLRSDHTAEQVHMKANLFAREKSESDWCSEIEHENLQHDHPNTIEGPREPSPQSAETGNTEKWPA